MKILADQVFATLGLPWDSKLSNLVLDEDRMIVESIPEYLLRVDLNSRYLGLNPIILFPAGTYEINDFLEQCKNGPIYWRQYVFDTTIEDIGLVELIITAAQGIQGIAGGEQGPQGIIGSQGIIGEASQGTQGLQGDLGVQGRMGTFGLQGIQGLRGSQGLVGYGAQGALGDVTEVQGIQGNPGIQGHMGTVGLQGIQGLRGSQGTSIQGTQGTQGTIGETGIQGSIGEGVQGDIGIQGSGLESAANVYINVILGYLYNWWAATDARSIAPEGWHVPVWNEYNDLLTFLGGTIDGGIALKSTDGWLHSTGTNTSGFSAHGSGWRDEGYSQLLLNCVIWLSDYREDQYAWYINILDEQIIGYPYIADYELWLKTMGSSIRLIKDDSVDTGAITGNDGKVYPTVKIGDQVWMAANLMETKYRNGDLITGPTFTDEEWDALTTEAYCIYDDDVDNAADGFVVKSVQGTQGTQGFSIQGQVGESVQGELGSQGNQGSQGIQGPAGEGGAETFLDLTDSPSAYTGQSGKLVAVASGEGGLEFVDAPSGEDNYVDGATFSGTTRDLTLTRTGILEDLTVNIPCCDPTEVIQGAVTNIEYGALYNWWAATDERNIAPAGWHVPTDAEYVILREYLDPLGNHIENIAGTKLKETGLTHWQTGGGTNDVGFNARGSGVRNDQGLYTGLTIGIYLWNSTPYPYNQVDGYHGFIYDGTTWFRIGLTSTSKKSGSSIRLIKDNQTDTGTMVGNDGKVYPTVTIGTQVWMAANSAETKYRNGDPISFHGETYADKYTNEEWAALTTEAMCWYDDTLDNGYTGVAVIQHNALGVIQGGSTTERYHHTKAEVDTHVYEAPEDGKQYARKDGAWEEVVAGEGTGTVVEINSAGDLVLNPGESNEETYTPPCTCDPLDMIGGATYPDIKYGALYNWYAATDERNIANVGFDIPSYEDGLTLYNYCGGTNDEFFNKLANLGFVTLEGIKQLFIDSGQEVPPDEVILSMIEPINANITNEYNFSFKSSGFRFFGTNLGSTDMGFQSGFWLKEIIQGDFYARHAYFMPPGMGAGSSVGWTGDHRIGMSIRLVRPATEAELLLADGTFCTPYIGNDGKIYQTVKIGTQVWLAENLAETKYRNGDLISNHGETYTDKYTNAEWAALTTEAMCWYDDNIDNGYTPVAVLQHNSLGGLQGGSTLERYHHTKAEADTHVYEAPIDGDAYVRKDGAWEIMPESSGGSIIEKISFEYKDIETGVSQTYWLDDIAKYGYTILGAILCSNTTMGAVEIQINGTPVIFGSNSYIDVTTSSADTEATDDNVVVEDDVVTLVTSGTDGGAEYLRGSIYYQRT